MAFLRNATCAAASAAVAVITSPAFGAPQNTQIVGQVRVEALSPSLVRLEVKGPTGFEDRATFHVVERHWPGVNLARNRENGFITLATPNWTVRVPENATTLDGITITDPGGKVIYTPPQKLTNAAWLPAPAEKTAAWAVADTPRIVPPSWGATPAPSGNTLHPGTSGWDTGNDAPDLYVFLPSGGDYHQLRSDYLRLTGPTELPPLYLFGLFHSRYHPYSDADARGIIATYRQKQIPLDVMVLDTDWRIGASVGYAANTQLFPDLPKYLQDVHAMGIRTMFNDHPEPKADGALDPQEMAFRYDGLSQWLNRGMDIWWYDRNWGISLKSPAPGLRHEVWGMQVYHDMTQKAVPDRRPAIMANVDGIDNGRRNRPPDMAAHRFPIQWTGDTQAHWEFLQYGVENAVYSGVSSLVPYMSEDLGGHVGRPSNELYVRYLEYGALSPTMRPHSTRGQTRAPWEYGPEAEKIVTDYVRMRYRLLPYLYTTARANYDTGDPMLRRLDLQYPQFPEAAANDEYLLGPSLLVAPILKGTSVEGAPVPGAWLTTLDGKPGLTANYFDNENLTGTPKVIRTDPQIQFDWGQGSPAPALPNDHFSCRWAGKITNPLSRSVTLQVVADDGVRVFLDDKAVVSEWHPSDASEAYKASVPLEPGKTYSLRVEYQELDGDALCRLSYSDTAAVPAAAQRSVWVPPGGWTNVWTGETLIGPKTLTVSAPLAQIPLFVRPGALIPLIPQMQYSSERPWDTAILEAFPAANTLSAADLYEDDTTTNAYKTGAFRTTHLESSFDTRSQRLRLLLSPAKGKSFPGAVATRQWTLRIHNAIGFPIGKEVLGVQVNGKPVTGWNVIPRATAPDAMPFTADGPSPSGDVLQIALPAAPVSQQQEVIVTYRAPQIP